MQLLRLLALLPLTLAAAADLSNLNLTTTTSFPFTPKVNSHLRLLNGPPTPLTVSLTNNEAYPVTINLVGATLWTPDTTTNLKNFTSRKIGKKVKPAEKYEVHYALHTDLKEQEALLNVALVVTTDKGEVVTVTAWNETVVIREEIVSLLDPQV